MTMVLLAVIITIILSPFIMNNFSVTRIPGHGSPFIHPSVKQETIWKNLSNQRIKLNEEDSMDIELESIIKMLKQVKKKLAKCEKHKSHI